MADEQRFEDRSARCKAGETESGSSRPRAKARPGQSAEALKRRAGRRAQARRCQDAEPAEASTWAIFPHIATLQYYGAPAAGLWPDPSSRTIKNRLSERHSSFVPVVIAEVYLQSLEDTDQRSLAEIPSPLYAAAR